MNRKKPRESREKNQRETEEMYKSFGSGFNPRQKSISFLQRFFFVTQSSSESWLEKILWFDQKKKRKQRLIHVQINKSNKKSSHSGYVWFKNYLHQFVLFLENVSILGSYPRSGKKSELICLTFQVEPIFDCFRRANAPKKPFFCLQTAYYICVPFHFEPIFDKFCRANALEKSFVWLQTAFAWKVKLLSNTFAWVQNSLIFS